MKFDKAVSFLLMYESIIDGDLAKVELQKIIEIVQEEHRIPFNYPDKCESTFWTVYGEFAGSSKEEIEKYMNNVQETLHGMPDSHKKKIIAAAVEVAKVHKGILPSEMVGLYRICDILEIDNEYLKELIPELNEEESKNE